MAHVQPKASRGNGRSVSASSFPAVKDIEISHESTVDEIFRQMANSGGFQARNLAQAVNILESMCRDRTCFKFLSFPAAIIATGTRGVIKEIVKRKYCDAIITTCGTLDHDLARSYAKYLSGGEFTMDDVELQKILSQMYQRGEKNVSTRLLCQRLGESIRDEASILYWATKNNIPVFVPGITDGAVGSQAWLFYQTHRDFKIDLLADEQALSDIVYSSRSTGALMLGGGISKHHTLWWNQFRGVLDYAVYITSATEYDGSLSGAQVREAISWGKVSTKARHVTVFGEITTLLPFVLAALIQRRT